MDSDNTVKWTGCQIKTENTHQNIESFA